MRFYPVLSTPPKRTQTNKHTKSNMLFAGKWPELERETAKMRENREGAWEGSEGKMA